MATTSSMRQLARKRLDDRMQPLRIMAPWMKAAPNGGWIRAIREALGMSAQDLGRRMGVSGPRVYQLEAGETSGNLNMATLSRAAAALDCELVVALVPRKPLEERVQERRMRLAKDWIRTRLLHTMSLEDQAVDFSDLPPAVLQEVEEMYPDTRLWKEP